MKTTSKDRDTYVFYKAGQVVQDEPVKDLVIEISTPIERMEEEINYRKGWENKWRDFYEAEGVKLGGLLRERLPGGTFNALLVNMLDRTRCILKVPFPSPPENRVETVQEAFDLIASLVEDINLRQDQPGSGVWDAAGEFCERMRDSGIMRNKFACDYDRLEE